MFSREAGEFALTVKQLIARSSIVDAVRFSIVGGVRSAIVEDVAREVGDRLAASKAMRVEVNFMLQCLECSDGRNSWMRRQCAVREALGRYI